MIIAQQMERSVYCQQSKFVFKAVSRVLGLLKSLVRRNDNIPQQFGVHIRIFALSHGESEHIGGRIYSAIVQIKLADVGVVNEQYADLAIRALFSIESYFNRLADWIELYFRPSY